MVRVRPGVGSVCKASVCQEVKHLLVGVILRAEEDEVLEGVRQPVVVIGLRGKAEVAVDNRRLCPSQNYRQSCFPRPDMNLSTASSDEQKGMEQWSLESNKTFKVIHCQQC